MSADLPGFAPPVDRSKKPPLLTLAVRSDQREELLVQDILTARLYLYRVSSSSRSRRRGRWSRAFKPQAR